MRYSKIKNYDVANGPGFRVSLFTQGCPHRCKGCFNPETWNYIGGLEYDKDVESKILKLLENPKIQGLTLLGGEPLIPCNIEYLLSLCKKTKELGKDIWLYTGFLYEDVLVEYNYLLTYIDVIVDGPFVEDLKDLTLKYRGSSNQRIIELHPNIDCIN